MKRTSTARMTDSSCLFVLQLKPGRAAPSPQKCSGGSCFLHFTVPRLLIPGQCRLGPQTHVAPEFMAGSPPRGRRQASCGLSRRCTAGSFPAQPQHPQPADSARRTAQLPRARPSVAFSWHQAHRLRRRRDFRELRVTTSGRRRKRL